MLLQYILPGPFSKRCCMTCVLCGRRKRPQTLNQNPKQTLILVVNITSTYHHQHVESQGVYIIFLYVTIYTKLAWTTIYHENTLFCHSYSRCYHEKPLFMTTKPLLRGAQSPRLAATGHRAGTGRRRRSRNSSLRSPNSLRRPENRGLSCVFEGFRLFFR